MAASTTLTKLVDGSKRQVLHVTILSDGAELTDSVVYDFSEDSTLTGDTTAGKIKIDQVWFSNPTAAGQIFVEHDGSTDRLACGSGFNSNDHQDFRSFGGISNHAASATGDVTVTTLGFANGDQAVVILDIKKC
tara:strand:+ start:36 stop:437 length:402 start_codon:yes stop_codon:yes gene_type:complete